MAKKGAITMRVGRCVLHGLTLEDAKALMDERGSDCSAGRVGIGNALPPELAAESSEELAAFTEWYNDLRESSRARLSPQLKNVSRRLVRHRGFRMHQIPAGKCRRVAKEIKEVLQHSSSGLGDDGGADVVSDGSCEAPAAAEDCSGASISCDEMGPPCYDMADSQAAIAMQIDVLTKALESLPADVAGMRGGEKRSTTRLTVQGLITTR